MPHSKNDELKNSEIAISDQRVWINAARWKTILILVMAVSWPLLGLKAYGPRPWDSNFDPSTFKISMVRSNIEFKMFALTHWPLGTPRSIIDEALERKSDMHVRELGRPSEIAFGYNIDPQLRGLKANFAIEYSRTNALAEFVGGGGLRVFAFYDSDSKLLQMIYSTTVIY
jgi:hypothetical protein